MTSPAAANGLSKRKSFLAFLLTPDHSVQLVGMALQRTQQLTLVETGAVDDRRVVDRNRRRVGLCWRVCRTHCGHIEMDGIDDRDRLHRFGEQQVRLERQ
jgi:hypothetical protein